MISRGARHVTCSLACRTLVQHVSRLVTTASVPLYHPVACPCRGPQIESEFESGQTSEEYAAKLTENVWLRSDECKKAGAVDLTKAAPKIADAVSLISGIGYVPQDYPWVGRSGGRRTRDGYGARVRLRAPAKVHPSHRRGGE